MTDSQHYLQDARLKKALANAPDAQIMPKAATRKAIIDAACQANQTQTAKAVHPAQKKPTNWLLRLNQFLFDSPRISWSALGSLLVVGCVALLWSLNDPKEVLSQGDLLQPPVAAPDPTLPMEAPQQKQNRLESDADITSARKQVIAEPMPSIETVQQTASNENLELNADIVSPGNRVSVEPTVKYEKTPPKEIVQSLNQEHTSSMSKKSVDQNATEKSKNAVPATSEKEIPTTLTQTVPAKPIEQKAESFSQQAMETPVIQAPEPVARLQGQMQRSSSNAQKQTEIEDQKIDMEQNNRRDSLTADAPANTPTSKDTRTPSFAIGEDTSALSGLAVSSGQSSVSELARDSMPTSEATNQSDFAAASFDSVATGDVAVVESTSIENPLPSTAHLSKWDSLEIQQRGVINVLTYAQSEELSTLITRILETTAITQQPLASFKPPKTDVILLRFFEKQQLRGTLYIDRLNWFFVAQPNKTQTVITGALTTQDAEQLKEKLKRLSP